MAMESTLPIFGHLAEVFQPLTPTPYPGDKTGSIAPPEATTTAKKRKLRQSKAKKTQRVLDVLSEEELSVYDLLRGIREREEKNPTSGRSTWRNFLARIHVKDDALLNALLKDSPAGEPVERSWPSRQKASLERMEWIPELLRGEVLAVGNSDLFKRWNKDTNSKGLYNVELKGLLEAIEKEAPYTSRFLSIMMQSQHAKENKKSLRPQLGPIAMVFSIMCFQQQKTRANSIPTQLGILLHSRGVKRSVLELCNRLGLIIPYQGILLCVKKSSDLGSKAIKSIGRSNNCCIQYDNLEQMQGVKEQRMDSNRKLKSVVTGHVIQGGDIPPQGLKASMMDYSKPLRVAHVLEAPGLRKDEIRWKCIDFLINLAIHDAFPAQWKRLYEDRPPPADFMPRIDRLVTRKTVSHSLGPIDTDESTTKGNIEVLENIHFEQIGLERDNSRWGTNLRLVYGDQLTFSRLWGIKRRRAEQETPGYGRMTWLMPAPALFHTKMIYLTVIHKAHWASTPLPDPEKAKQVNFSSKSTASGKRGRKSKDTYLFNDPSYLRHAQAFWGRKDVGPSGKNNFWALDEFLTHSFQARIIAALWVHISPHDNKQSHTAIEEWLAAHTAEEVNEIVIFIRNDLFVRVPEHEEDTARQNHMKFLQSMEPYFVLKHGIKWGDIGLISRALDRMCLYFHGSSSCNYAKLMLWWKHYTNSGSEDSAVDSKLARAILSNSLVNTTGRPGMWKETDLFGEHLNGQMKIMFHERCNSTFNFDHLFKYISLNTRFFKDIKEAFHSLLNVYQNGHHSVKDPAIDLYEYARDEARV